MSAANTQIKQLQQVYAEWSTKAAEIILSARVRQSAVGAQRKQSFNLGIPELFNIRTTQVIAKPDFFEALRSLEIEFSLPEDDASKNAPKADLPTADKDVAPPASQSDLVERWTFTFLPVQQERHLAAPDRRNQTLVRKLCVTLRSLLCFTRLLPAYAFYRDQRGPALRWQFCDLAGPTTSRQSQELITKEFVCLPSSIGTLKLSVSHRKDLSSLPAAAPLDMVTTYGNFAVEEGYVAHRDPQAVHSSAGPRWHSTSPRLSLDREVESSSGGWLGGRERARSRQQSDDSTYSQNSAKQDQYMHSDRAVASSMPGTIQVSDAYTESRTTHIKGGTSASVGYTESRSYSLEKKSASRSVSPAGSLKSACSVQDLCIPLTSQSPPLRPRTPPHQLPGVSGLDSSKESPLMSAQTAPTTSLPPLMAPDNQESSGSQPSKTDKMVSRGNEDEGEICLFGMSDDEKGSEGEEHQGQNDDGNLFAAEDAAAFDTETPSRPSENISAMFSPLIQELNPLTAGSPRSHDSGSARGSPPVSGFHSPSSTPLQDEVPPPIVVMNRDRTPAFGTGGAATSWQDGGEDSSKQELGAANDLLSRMGDLISTLQHRKPMQITQLEISQEEILSQLDHFRELAQQMEKKGMPRR